jgi:ESX secretion-associated protein EspG
MGRSFTLSLAAADIVAQFLGVNLRLFPFDIPSVGQFQADRTRIARAVFTDLAKRGLANPNGLDPELERAVRTVSDYVIAVAVMGTVEKTKEIYARVCATNETGVLAVKEKQSMRLELIRPTALALTLAGLLPKLQAGPGQSVTISPAPARPRREDDERSVFGEQPRASTDQQQRAAAAYLARPRTGTGFFAVSARDRHGREVRAGGLTWLDTDAGRYLTLSRPEDAEGAVTGTIFPADTARLTQQLGEMIESVAPER